MKLHSIGGGSKGLVNRGGGGFGRRKLVQKNPKGFVPEYMKTNRKSPQFDRYLEDKDRIFRTAKLAEQFVQQALAKKEVVHSMEGSGRLIRKRIRNDKLGLDRFLSGEAVIKKKSISFIEGRGGGGERNKPLKNPMLDDLVASLLSSPLPASFSSSLSQVHDIKDIAEYKPNMNLTSKSVSYIVERSLPSKEIDSLELFNKLAPKTIQKVKKRKCFFCAII